MTCIVGLVHDGVVWMGGDSAGIADLDLTVRADPKVFRRGSLMLGVTSSFRMRDLLQFSFSPPERDDSDTRSWLVKSVVPAIRDCLKDGGFAQKESEQEVGGLFLIGCQGRLFRIDGDYQVGVPADGFCAIGCGGQIANGALYATQDMPPHRRIRLALEAAERFSAGVRGPFDILQGYERS